MRNKLLLITLLILAFSKTFSQSNEIITGILFDLENKRPIKNVNIKILGTSKGTITDSRGVFYLQLDTYPSKLEITHIAFNDTLITINKQEKSKLEIGLTQKINKITEINIFANKKIEELTKNKLLDLSDFDFYGDSIILIAYDWTKKQNPWIILMNENGDTLFKSNINFDGKFYKDCFGNTHLLTEKFAYQLYFNKNKLEFLYEENTEKFIENISPCIQSLNNKLYIKQYSYRNQVLSYYNLNLADSTNTEMRVITDWIGARMVYDNENGHSIVNIKSDADARFEEMCFFDPIYSPLVKINDTISILNFIDNQIEFYNDKNILLSKIAIDFHKNNKWKEQIFVDEVTSKIYSLFINNGNTTIKEISKKNGSVIRTVKIPNFNWIEKIIIRNGIIFFLYRKNNNLELTRLYKLEI